MLPPLGRGYLAVYSTLVILQPHLFKSMAQMGSGSSYPTSSKKKRTATHMSLEATIPCAGNKTLYATPLHFPCMSSSVKLSILLKHCTSAKACRLRARHTISLQSPVRLYHTPRLLKENPIDSTSFLNNLLKSPCYYKGHRNK